jgi:hypothetical protein
VVVPTAQYVHFATHYLLTETTRVTAGGGYFCVPGLTSGLVLIDDERVRDLAALSVPMAGRLEQTDDPWLPFRLVDAGGAVVEAVSVYFRDLQAAGKPDTTIRSYGMDLLRWFGFLWAIDVSWSRASRIEARDFLGG